MNSAELVSLFQSFELMHLSSKDPAHRNWDSAFAVIDDAADVLLGKKEDTPRLTIMCGVGLYNRLAKVFGETETRAGLWVEAGDGRIAVFPGNLSGAIRLVGDIPCLERRLDDLVRSLITPVDGLLELGANPETISLLKMAFSPEGQKMLTLKPGVSILLKRDKDSPMVVTGVDRSNKYGQITVTALMTSGLEMTFITGMNLSDALADHNVLLSEIIVLNAPSIDDMQWLERNNVHL